MMQNKEFWVRLVRRVVPLLILGATVGWVVSHFRGQMRNEIQMEIVLRANQIPARPEMQLTVCREGEEETPLSVAVFLLRAEEGPWIHLHHTLRIPSGRYRLRFSYGLAQEPGSFVADRTLESSSDANLRVEIP
jgi:hypothetical protein